MKPYTFKNALAVWEKDKDREMNYNLIFRSVVEKGDDVIVALTASSMYQLFVNGKFVAEGPARAGHGYYRVDEIDISKHLTKDKNIVSIYVNGYYVENYYLIKAPSFLCAEIISNGAVVAATGREGFEAKYHGDRIRKIVRFSGQRTFAEAYRYDGSYRDFDTKLDASFEKVNLVVTDWRRFIERGVEYPCYDECQATEIVSRGKADFYNTVQNPTLGWYASADWVSRFDDCDIVNTDEVDKGEYTCTQNEITLGNSAELSSNEYVIFKQPCEKTGFIRFNVECSADTELICIFDEVLDDGDVTTKRLTSLQRSVVWFLKKGKYSIITNEPYTAHYMKFVNKSDGDVKLSGVGITEFAAKLPKIILSTSNENLNLIYKAALETYKQNAIDIFTDCPSRERAGWLCDSFFTARVEKEIFGESRVEKNFLENFVFADNPNHIDSRMIPMCYPADHKNANFIPNWAMWYVLELEEYLLRSGDRELIELSKKNVDNLLEYFNSFENGAGLLEDLEKWVFVDFTDANNFVDGVNYPSNMLYAKMLEAAYNLYGDKALLVKSEKIKEEIRKQSYCDGFFRDHAVRKDDGTLELVMSDTSESCQYYAFFTGTADKKDYPSLYTTIINEFGPNNKGKYPDIVPANAFIGLYIRLDMLANDGDGETVLRDIEGCFTHMARTTGTLWEDKNGTFSCNHGFGSHVIVWLNRFLRDI